MKPEYITSMQIIALGGSVIYLGITAILLYVTSSSPFGFLVVTRDTVMPYEPFLIIGLILIDIIIIRDLLNKLRIQAP